MTAGKISKWWHSPRALLRAILMLDDTPHAIALGTAIGVFIGLTPTVGLQMLVVVVFAFLTYRLFYFNRMAAIITVYISNPLTIIPIYWLLYCVGSYIVSSDLATEDFTDELQAAVQAGWWDVLEFLIVGVGWPMLVGSLIVGGIGAVITYPLMRWLLKSFHNPLPKVADSPSSQEQTPASPTHAE